MPASRRGLRPDPPLLALLSGVLLTTVTQSALVPALPPLGVRFGVGPGAVQAVLSSGLFAAAAAFVPLALLAGRVGGLRVFRAALVVHAVTSVALSLAPDFRTLVILRVLQGVAIAGVVGLVPGLAVAAWPDRRGSAMGLIASTVALGQLIGPLSGGLLTERFGPLSVFWLSPPLAVFSLALSRHLPDFSAQSFSLGGLLRRGFLVGLFRTVSYFAYVFGAILATSFLLASLGVGPARVGGWLLLPPAVLAVLGAWGGAFADRAGFRRSMRLGVSVMALGVLIGYLALRLSPGLAALVVLLTVGAGRAFFQSANNADVLSRAPAGAEALASALLSVSRVAGQALGSTGVGVILEAGARLGPARSYALALGVLVLPLLLLTLLRHEHESL